MNDVMRGRNFNDSDRFSSDAPAKVALVEPTAHLGVFCRHARLDGRVALKRVDATANS